MPCIQAVVFDVDGVMIDSERLGFRIYQRILAGRGHAIGDEHFARMMGLDLVETAEYFIRETGITIDPIALNDLYLDQFNQALQNELEPFPGLHELFRELGKRRLPLGIASNSPVDYLERVIQVIHAEGVFQAIVGRDLVALGKPAPEVYLRAAELLGVSPEACLAIEDSPVGMQSALAAGMRCAVVNEACAETTFAPATARFTDLHALRAALDGLLGE